MVVARREGLTATDALDAMQEAFHTFLGLPQARSLAMGDREDAERLMAVLVRNAARNQRRRHHRALPHDGMEVAEALAGDQPGADELISMAEDHLALLGCVSQLSEVQRHVVTLRMIEGVAAGRVAEQLGLSAGNVAVLLHRAKKAIQNCLTM